MAPQFGLPNLPQFFADALKKAEGVVRGAPQQVQRAVPAVNRAAQATQNAYKRLPPAVRAGLNPLSSAGPTRAALVPFARFMGGQLLVDAAVSELANRVLPPDAAREVSEFYALTSLPVPVPLKLGAYVLGRSTPVNKNEDEIMRQIHADYYAKKAKAEANTKTNVENQNFTGGGLEARGPAAPAFRPPGAPPAPSPSQAAATTALPSQGPAPAATAPDKMNELARLYAEQKQMGTELGAEEMVRRMRAASPSRYSMPEQDLVKWAASNPALAYREMVRREGLAG